MSRYTVATLAVFAAAILAAAPARAHFVLQAPANWAQQDATGVPIKSAPCGQADPGTPAVATNAITAFAQGATVTITINETIAHPGHYRVSLSTTGQSGLPADPPVTAGGTPSTPCGSTTIMSAPVYPVIADGMLVHTAAFTSPQSFTVTLPSNMTCASNCVLQVVEFMSNHPLNNPGGCFYHHCANITIGAGTGGTGGGAGGRGGAGGAGGRGGTGGAGGRGGTGGAAGRGGAGGVTGTGGGGAGTTGSGGTTATGAAGTTGTGGTTATGAAGTTGTGTGTGGTTATGAAGTTGTGTGTGGGTSTGTAGTTGTGGVTGTGGTTSGGGSDGGGGCTVGGGHLSLPALLIALVIGGGRRRRRRD